MFVRLIVLSKFKYEKNHKFYSRKSYGCRQTTLTERILQQTIWYCAKQRSIMMRRIFIYKSFTIVCVWKAQFSWLASSWRNAILFLFYCGLGSGSFPKTLVNFHLIYFLNYDFSLVGGVDLNFVTWHNLYNERKDVTDIAVIVADLFEYLREKKIAI